MTVSHEHSDRENATVFVADLPASTKEDELKTLFKDCGRVREVKLTQLADALVALVEFFDRVRLDHYWIPITPKLTYWHGVG